MNEIAKINQDVKLRQWTEMIQQRKESGLTQSQLADKIGISISYLTKIEAEKCNKSISLSILNNIANSLNVEITEFFKETD